MNNLTVSQDGCCPSCTSDNWKLAKVIVASGTSVVDTESDGGGWGAGVGSGGVGVNYQGVNLDTKGTFTTTEAAKFADLEPQMPDCYNKKSSLISNCTNAMIKSQEGIEKVDRLALKLDTIKPHMFGGISDRDFQRLREEYDSCAATLKTIEEYDINKALWDKMRVCGRCGESFVTTADMQQANSRKIKIPKFTFKGEDGRCPSCMSYIWKTTDAFFDIKIRELQSVCSLAKKKLDEAVDYANNSTNGGFFKKLWKEMTTPTPEKAQEAVDKAQSQLANVFQRRKEGIKQFNNFEKVRVCVECEKLYMLE